MINDEYSCNSRDLIDLLPQIKPDWMIIITDLVSYSFQTALGYICLDIVLAISLHFAAEESENLASGIGFAYSLFSLIILPIGLGLNQSLNVHVSQSLGAHQQQLSKTYLTMTIYIHLLYTLPLCLILYYLKTPLSYTFPIEDRAEIVQYTWEYLPYLMLSYVFSVELECFKSYMLAYEITTPFIFIHFITTGLHVFWCWFFMEKFSMSIQGAGLALIITEFSNLILLYIYLQISQDQKIFLGVSWQPSFGLAIMLSYIKSSFAIIVQVCLDYIVFFVYTFLSMQLGRDLFYAQVALSNTCCLYFRIPLSLSLGLMTFIGTQMGKQNIYLAKCYALAGGLIFLVVAFFLMGFLWIFRDKWVFFYAPNSDIVREAMLEILPYFILGCLLMDGIQGSMSGALKGIEKTELVSYTALVIYYFFGIPLVLVLTFSWGFDLKLRGIWLGLGISNTLLSVIYIGSLLTSDWNKQAQLIHKRISYQKDLQN